jgi:hypothetical protein
MRKVIEALAKVTQGELVDDLFNDVAGIDSHRSMITADDHLPHRFSWW